jgi:16S rRNA (uracil1498-N3)-methyltransferase
MRAVYLPTTSPVGHSKIEIEGEAHHHLSNVVRLRIEEKVRLLFGKGRTGVAKVLEITKKRITVEVGEILTESPTLVCDVAILLPKREALELMLKNATELGVNNVYLVRGIYSQEKLPVESRIEAIIESAMEQSNNSWGPKVTSLSSVEELGKLNYESYLYLDVPGNSLNQADGIKAMGKSLLVIGPEAGFAAEERDFLKQLPHSRAIVFSTPILRAPTAMVAGVGWWLARA